MHSCRNENIASTKLKPSLYSRNSGAFALFFPAETFQNLLSTEEQTLNRRAHQPRGMLDESPRVYFTNTLSIFRMILSAH